MVAFPAYDDARIFAEKDRIGRLGRIRQLVFGSLDGLLVPLGVISGVAGGTENSHIVVIAGIVEAFAGALSMGAGEFISARSEAQVQKTEITRELEGLRTNPEDEQEEMTRLLEHEGIATRDARRIVEILVQYPEAYHKTMVEKELGLQIDPATVKIPEALTIGISYIIGSLFPLIAYFFFAATVALPLSLLLTFVALVIVGIIKGRLTSLNLLGSIGEIVLVGAVSAGGGYFLGQIIPHLFGF
jgi:vacuolar iron transporter family protein